MASEITGETYNAPHEKKAKLRVLLHVHNLHIVQKHISAW